VALQKPSSDKAVRGSWVGGTLFNPTGTLTIGVVNTSRTVSGEDSSNEGKQFLMMSGVAGEPVGQIWTANGWVDNSNPGDTIEFTIAFKLAPDSNRALVYLYGGVHQNYLLAAFGLNGDHVGFRKSSLSTHNGEEFEQTRLRFNPDVWNTMKVTHKNGTDKWYVSFNGERMREVDVFRDTTDFNLNAFNFNQTTDSARGTTVYFDAVAPKK
jgi:hypothetical protein